MLQPITAVNVTTDPTHIADYDSERSWIMVQNVSDTDIYLKLNGSSAALTTANGIRLEPGEILTMDNSQGSKIATNYIQAIHSGSGNKEVRVQGGD